jgi:bacteriocin-like protein
MRKGDTKDASKAKKPSRLSTDSLLKPSNKRDIELTEKELDKVSGGSGTGMSKGFYEFTKP